MLKHLEEIKGNLGDLCKRLNDLDVLFSGVKPQAEENCFKEECLEDSLKIILIRTREALDYVISIKETLDGGKN